MPVDQERLLEPQQGPQAAFAAASSDIVIYGGQAGGGKTYALLMKPMPFLDIPGYGAVIFRRTRPMITAEGAMWDQSYEVYGGVGSPRDSALQWIFDCERFGGAPGESSVKFSHMEYEKNRLDWQGAQIPHIGFDQLETFTSAQFFFMLARNRTMLPLTPRVFATANPDAGSWLAEFIQWWWDPDTGYPIPERSGVERYFVRVSNTIEWGDDPHELKSRFPDLPAAYQPRSVTFIPSSIYDNPMLIKNNPEYLSNLMSLSTVERERLLYGNWKIKHVAGGMFPPGCFEIIPAAPAQAYRVRYWDEASTDAGGDWTSGVLMAWHAGVFYVEDVVRGQWATGQRDAKIRQTAELDARLVDPDGNANTVTQIHQQEGGSSGKDRARGFVAMLPAHPARVDPVSGDKVSRADAYSAQAQVSNVKLVSGAWNKAFVDEHEMFPTDGVPDDQVDSASGAYNRLAPFVQRLMAQASARKQTFARR